MFGDIDALVGDEGMGGYNWWVDRPRSRRCSRAQREASSHELDAAPQQKQRKTARSQHRGSSTFYVDGKLGFMFDRNLNEELKLEGILIVCGFRTHSIFIKLF